MRCTPPEYTQISFLEDRPASPFPSRELGGQRLILATDGRRCAGSYTRSGPVGLLLRTLVASSIWRSTLYSLTWKMKTTRQGRSYCQLLPSARPIAGTDASSWATPNAIPCGMTSRTSGRAPEKSTHLQAQVGLSMWPTATVHGNHNVKKAKSGDGLSTAVRQWPTPRSQSMTGACRHGTGGEDIQTAVSWSTPAAQDAKNAGLPPSQAARDTLPGDLIREKARGQLNPDWVECLMGFPRGWTSR